MSQLLISQCVTKRLLNQNFQITECHQKNPSFNQTDLIKHFNNLFGVNIPVSTMSGIKYTTRCRTQYTVF